MIFSPIIEKIKFCTIDISKPSKPSKKKIKALVSALSINFVYVSIICSILDRNILKTGYTAPKIPEETMPKKNNN